MYTHALTLTSVYYAHTCSYTPSPVGSQADAAGAEQPALVQYYVTHVQHNKEQGGFEQWRDGSMAKHCMQHWTEEQAP